MRLYYILLISILTHSCASNSEQGNEEKIESTYTNSSKAKTGEPGIKIESQSQENPEITNQYTIDDIQGTWGSFDSLENSYYFIEGDSIFYIGGESFPVEVVFDSIRINYDYGPSAFKINWIRGDTMSYENLGSEHLIFRRFR